MKVGIFYNKKYLADNRRNIELIKNLLKERGAECAMVEGADELKGLDVLFVLGGDGTILTLASECARRGVKIIGVNYGHVGFLAEFEPEKLRQAVELVCGGGYDVQKRSMLEINCGGNIYYALNDFVVQRNTSGSNFSNTVSLSAVIDGVTADIFSSDGLIVSTPTGSTAYSLSAGGAILTPDISAFILTPVCAHSLHARPIVFDDKSVLQISSPAQGGALVTIVDGKFAGAIEKGEKITVKKSAYTADFIIKKDNNFFNKLYVKLNKWSK